MANKDIYIRNFCGLSVISDVRLTILEAKEAEVETLSERVEILEQLVDNYQKLVQMYNELLDKKSENEKSISF